jgi:hypothetical protein
MRAEVATSRDVMLQHLSSQLAQPTLGREGDWELTPDVLRVVEVELNEALVDCGDAAAVSATCSTHNAVTVGKAPAAP